MLAVVLVAGVNVAAKDWRGLLPMHSTRADVINLLGRAVEGGSWDYSLEDVDVSFSFSATGSCDGTVAEGTLLAISVRPKNQMTLASLNFDESNFRRFNITDANPELVGLIDEQQGVVVRVATKFVEEVVYVPSVSDRPRCAKYFNNLEDSVKPVPPITCWLSFEQYGNIRFEDEKARLDNFAIQLQNDPDLTGYILAYAGRKAVVAEAQLRANRARDYIISVRHINPARVKAIDGGHREDFTVYLNLFPSGAAPPVPDPTIDPKDVEIVYPKKRRPRSKNH